MRGAIIYKPEPKKPSKTNSGRPLDLKAKQTLQKRDYWKIK